MSKHDRKLVARGYTSIIYTHEDPSKVIKVLVGKDAQANFEIELRAYESLSTPAGRPASLLKFFGIDDSQQHGLILEYAMGGDLYTHLWRSGTIDTTTKWKWTRQACQALEFVHNQGIIHGDVHAVNFFLDSDNNLKLGDFGAASVDGKPALMMYRSSHQLWLQKDDGKWYKDYSVASEIFALGCVLYNIETQNGLYSENGQEIEEEAIKCSLKERRYPNLDSTFVLEKIIDKCWSGQYRSMTDVLKDLPAEHE